MRRSTVLSLPLLLVFPAVNITLDPGKSYYSIIFCRYRVCWTWKNAKFHIRQFCRCPKWVCQTLSMIFCFFLWKKDFAYIWHFLNTRQHIFCVGTQRSSKGAFPNKEGGIQVLAGRAPYSQIVVSLLRTQKPEKFGFKSFGKYNLIE